MSLDQHMQRIDRYLSRNEKQPIIVDVQNEADQSELVQYYNVGRNMLISASQYCAPDNMPNFDNLIQDLKTKEGILIVTGTSSFLKLMGTKELKKFIRSLLDLNTAGQVIFITYQCRQFLSWNDPRLDRRIIIIDGVEKKIPNIVFTALGIPLPQSSNSVKGIENFAEKVEAGSADTIYMITEKNKASFPDALYSITNLQDAYNAIALKDDATKSLPKTIGTDRQWDYALKLFEQKNLG